MLRRQVSEALFAALGIPLALAGCGEATDAAAPSSVVLTGVALKDTPVVGTISLSDSSLPTQTRTVASEDGTFSFDVVALTPPFLLKAESASEPEAAPLYTAAQPGGTADINPLTDAAVRASEDNLDEAFAESDVHVRQRIYEAFVAALAQLQGALAPLWSRYEIDDAGSLAGKDLACRLQAVFRDVTFVMNADGVTVSNRQAGTVIYTAPRSDLGSGTFYTENMPDGLDEGTCGHAATTCVGFTYSDWSACNGGTQTRTVISASPDGCTDGVPVVSQGCTEAAPTCTSFTYSDWGACVNGTQSRTVTSASPDGCTGGDPVLSQACTMPIDGAALYNQYCSGCHGSSKKGRSAAAITNAIASNRGGMGSLSFLTPEQIAAIAAAP